MKNWTASNGNNHRDSRLVVGFNYDETFNLEFMNREVGMGESIG